MHASVYVVHSKRIASFPMMGGAIPTMGKQLEDSTHIIHIEELSGMTMLFRLI